MKIFIVAPYEGMENHIQSLKDIYKNIEIDYSIGLMEEGVNQAKKAQKKGFDAIISRGGTAKIIKKNIDLPTIDMKLSGNDILKVLLIAKNSGKKSAIVAYENITNGAKEIIELLDLDIQVYTITNEKKVTEQLLEIKEKGVEQIIGDIVAVKKANEMRFSTLLCQSSKKTIQDSIVYAIDLIHQINKKEKSNYLFTKYFDIYIDDYILLDSIHIMRSKFINFSSSPVSYEYLIGLKYDFEKSVNNVKIYYSTDGETKITFVKIEDSNNDYNIVIFNKNEFFSKDIAGLYEYNPKKYYENIFNSDAMVSCIKKIEKNLRKNKIINIISNDTYTIHNIISYFEKNDEIKKTVILDFNLIEVKRYLEIDFNRYGNIIMKNVNEIDICELVNEVRDNFTNNIFIITEGSSSNLIVKKEIIPITLPSSYDRKEEIYSILKNVMAYYYTKKSTAPMILDENFKEDIEDFYDNTISDLISILKLCIFNYEGNIINSSIFKKYYDDYLINNLYRIDTSLTLEKLEYNYIEKILKEENYNQTKVAERLGISRTTLWRKLKGYHL